MKCFIIRKCQISHTSLGGMTYSTKMVVIASPDTRKLAKGFQPDLVSTGLHSSKDKLDAYEFRYRYNRLKTIRAAKTKALVRLCGSAGCSAPLLFAKTEIKFCHVLSDLKSTITDRFVKVYLWARSPHT